MRRTIDGPFVVAEIPPNFKGALSSVLASDVSSVKNGKRTKRHEIALAVAQQGINVYDIRQSRLVASYAVSPQTTFTCPPCSLYYRSTPDVSPRRTTYCAGRSPAPRIQCFYEPLDVDTGSVSPISSKTIRLKKDCAPVIHIEPVFETHEEGGTPKHSLLVVHQDGEIGCYSERLDREIWSSRGLTNSQRVHTAVLTSTRQAHKGLLKNRADVLASLSSDPQEDDSSLLVLLTRSNTAERPNNDSTLHLQCLRLPTYQINAQNTVAISQSLQRLLDISVPEPDLIIGQDSEFLVHAGTGMLYQRLSHSLVIYDLSDLIPKVAHEIEIGQGELTSFHKISSNTIATCTGSMLSLLSLPYCSIQAETAPFSSSASDSIQEADRKLSSRKILSFYSPLNMIVALDGNRIITLTINDVPENHNARKRKRENLLINSIGQGSLTKLHKDDRTSSAARGPISINGDSDWIKSKAELDSYFEKGQLELFDKLMVAQLSAKSQLPGFADNYKLSYLFTRMFTISEPQLSTSQEDIPLRTMSIKLFPRLTFNWLLERGLFTLSQVERALTQNGSLPRTEHLSRASFIEALFKWDSSLRLLQQLLESLTVLELEELIYIILALIGKWPQLESVEKKEKKLLTNHASSNDEPISIDSDPDDTSLRPHYIILHQLLLRLSRYSQSSVTQTLRSHVPKPRLADLIYILRVKIAESGYLSSYIYEQAPPSEPDPSTKQITPLRPLLHILNCSLNAIGTAGWILGSQIQSDFTDTAETITQMRAEVSAALEGIEEAVYLSGLLEEILLCGRDQLRPQAQARSQQTNNGLSQIDGSGDGRAVKPVTLPLVPSDPTADVLASNRALPLGLKLEKKIPLTKVGAGGEVMQRSKRDIGRLKSKNVGKYSFERIMV